MVCYQLVLIYINIKYKQVLNINNEEDYQNNKNIKNNLKIKEIKEIKNIPNEFLPSNNINIFNNIIECKDYISILKQYNIDPNIQVILLELYNAICEIQQLLLKETNEHMKHIEILSIEGLHCCGNTQLINEYVDSNKSNKNYVVYDTQQSCHCQYHTITDNEYDYCCVCNEYDIDTNTHNNTKLNTNSNTNRYGYDIYNSILNNIKQLPLDTPYRAQLRYSLQYIQFYMINIDIYQHKYKHVIIINYYHSLYANIINYNNMTTNDNERDRDIECGSGSGNETNSNSNSNSNIKPNIDVSDVVYKWPTDLLIPKFVSFI